MLEYLVAASAIMSSLAAVYLVFTRDKEHASIVEKYDREATKSLQNLSQNAQYLVEMFFEKITKNEHLQKTDEQLKKINENMQMLNKQMKALIDEQLYFRDKLSVYASENAALEKKIKERDAILHRKEKQIKRLKNEI